MNIDAKRAPRLFGLIGYPLSHSFSKKYFSRKYRQEGVDDCYYELFPLQNLEELPVLIKTYPNLVGLNVTIPYKEQVIPFMDGLGDGAAAIRAVNTIKVNDGRLSGYNSDIYGFRQSLQNFLTAAGRSPSDIKALVLGTGGAAKAVAYVLEKMHIPFLYLSRDAARGDLTYRDLGPAQFKDHHLIINTTPLGMAPKTATCPDLPYRLISAEHLLFDLVYNPEKTLFLSRGEERGSRIRNGLEMLHLQAERSWEIWNS